MNATITLEGGSEININIKDGDTVGVLFSNAGVELQPGDAVYNIREGSVQAVEPDAEVKDGDELFVEQRHSNGS